MSEEYDTRRIIKRWGMLKTERDSWYPHWKEISDNLLPYSGRFTAQDRNRGQRKHNKIYDSTARRALSVLTAGLMGGNTSPARPWFRLATINNDLMRSAAVKQWLDDMTRIMLDIFQRSNTYRALHMIYEDLGAFGTSACFVADDFDTVIHLHNIPVGRYALAANFKGEIDTMYREFEIPVHAMVNEFGIDAVSTSTRNLYQQGSLDLWVPCIHSIEPREGREYGKRDGKNMPYRSCYFEPNARDGKTLRESGFNQFRVLAPRWSATGTDVYGISPAMESLGDIKQLQHEQLRKAECIDFQTKPPLQIPSSLKNRDVDVLPGGKSYYDQTGPNNGIRTAFDVQLNLQHLLEDIGDVRGRINATFYADLFMMLANNTNSQMTATEVAERHEEKLLMLGPVLERLQNELIDPLVEITFNRIIDTGIGPVPPPEMQGQELNIELVSMLAQAQRAIGINSIDRFVGAMGSVAQISPAVLDRLDPDAWVDEYTDLAGVSPRLLVPKDAADQVRMARAKAQQAAQQEQSLATRSQSARNIAQATGGQQSALSDVTRQFAGYS
jgi:hypothetical protein